MQKICKREFCEWRGLHFDFLLMKYQLINSRLKMPKGNFGLELRFTKQKVKELRGGRRQDKVRKIFTFLVLMAPLTNFHTPNLDTL